MGSLLEADGLVAGYNEVPILHGVSVRLDPGEFVAIIGPNGAGKSTLIKAMFGLLKVSAGRVVFDGQDITRRSPEQIVALGVSYVPQLANTFPTLTVRENLQMGAYLLNYGISGRVSNVTATIADALRAAIRVPLLFLTLALAWFILSALLIVLLAVHLHALVAFGYPLLGTGLGGPAAGLGLALATASSFAAVNLMWLRPWTRVGVSALAVLDLVLSLFVVLQSVIDPLRALLGLHILLDVLLLRALLRRETTQALSSDSHPRAFFRVPRGQRRYGRLVEKEYVQARVNAVLELFPDLRPLLKVRTGKLSGGQQQMVALARALILEPKVLLIDEPSAGLAPKLVDAIFRRIREIHDAGTAVILVEQNARKALEMADRGYVFEMGRNRYAGPAKDLLANAEVRRLYLGG